MFWRRWGFGADIVGLIVSIDEAGCFLFIFKDRKARASFYAMDGDLARSSVLSDS